MQSTAKALYSFFSGFDLPAYTSDTVPDDEAERHITYLYSDPEHTQTASMYCQVWERSNSNDFILRKADEITGAIGEGLLLPCDGGYIRLHLENPVVQIMVDGDWRSAYINMSINAYHKPGA